MDTEPKPTPSEETEPKHSASKAARYIMDSFYSASSPYSEQELAGAGIKRAMHQPNYTDKIEVSGELDGEPVHQSLCITRNGNWVFATTYRRENGPLVQYQFKPGSARDHSPLIEEAISSSVFMQRLAALEASREQA